MSRLSYPDWEAKFKQELSEGKVFVITQEIGIDRRSIEGVEGSIFSQELGGPIDTEKDIREFTCDCGVLNGRFYEGELCQECNTTVQEHMGADLDRFGWLDIAPYHIISPAAYEMLVKVVGNKNLPKILEFQPDIDLEGHCITMSSEKSPWASIGMFEFKKHFREIIEYYGRLRGKMTEAHLLLANESAVFSSKIPVMSSFLRPAFASSSKKTLSYERLNAIYMKIAANIKVLKDERSAMASLAILSTLYSIQAALQELYGIIVSSKLSGKTKLIRSGILGARLSFSARLVIVSLVGKYSGFDTVEMSYKGFLELYKLEIINCMMRGIGDSAFAHMTVYEALEYFTIAQYSDKVDDKLYFIMDELVHKYEGGLRVLINRNPTMDLGSIQCMRIGHVTKDANKATLGIPLTSLKPMTADFDGDVLNVHSLKEKKVIEAFDRGFNPRMLVLDRTGDGFFNRDMGLIKDQMTNLFSLIAPLDEMFPNEPTESFDSDEMMGLGKVPASIRGDD